MSCYAKKTTATEQEIRAALKLIELLYIKGELPLHVYRNICADYFGRGLDITPSSFYPSGSAEQDAV